MANQQELKDEALAQHRKAGLWGIMNSLKREGDAQRATLAEQHGVNAANLPGFGSEIPFGNTFVSQSSTGSPLGKATQVAILALVAGAIGFGANSLLKEETPEPVTPPPVNAVIEWEITPDGDLRERSSSIRREESRISEEASRRDADGIDVIFD